MVDVLVLGASGFIGGHIARKAHQEGWRVHGLRRRTGAVGHIGDLPINWIEGDLNDYNSLLPAMAGKDYVFHAAASYPGSGNPAEVPQLVEHSTKQMNNVIRAMRESRAKRLVYTSSLTTIGQPQEGENRLADERDHYIAGSMPDNGYYECKSVMEKIAFDAIGVGYDIVILNPTLVLGPGDIHLSTGQVLVAFAQGKALALPSGDVNIIDVRDTGAAHINAARYGRSGQRYILGGVNYPISEAGQIIAELADVKPPRFTLPDQVIDLYIKAGDTLPFIPCAPDHLRGYKTWQGYNTEKARKEIKLETRFLEETIRDSLKWFSDRGVI